MRSHGARAFVNAIVPDHLGRELVVAVTLPEDRGRHGDARLKVHCFRSAQLELGRRLGAFRERYGLTQHEIARAVGAADQSAGAKWERGVNVPDGERRERLTELLAGCGPTSAPSRSGTAGPLPLPWERAARWYRRASRGRAARRTAGVVVSAVLDDLRKLNTADSLRRHYRGRDSEWARDVAARLGLAEEHGTGLRRLEDAGFGLRWIELAHGWHFDLRPSLVLQVPGGLLE